MKYPSLIPTLILCLLILLSAARSRADSLDTITATDVTIGELTLDMSFTYDLTTGQLVPGSTLIDFVGSPGFSAGFSFLTTSDDGTVFDWTDAAGDFLQFDPTNEEGENSNLFPQAGSFPTWIVDLDCRSQMCNGLRGPGFNGESGTLVVTDPPSVPEPATWILMLGGVAVIMLFAGRWRKWIYGTPGCLCETGQGRCEYHAKS